MYTRRFYVGNKRAGRTAGEKNGRLGAVYTPSQVGVHTLSRSPGLRKHAAPRRYRVMKNSAMLLASESTGAMKHSSVPVTEQSMPMAVVRLLR